MSGRTALKTVSIVLVAVSGAMTAWHRSKKLVAATREDSLRLLNQGLIALVGKQGVGTALERCEVRVDAHEFHMVE